MTFPPEVWDAVLHRLRSELTLQSCEAWLTPLVPLPYSDGLRILCPTRFHLERVRDGLFERIAKAVSHELGHPISIELGLTSEHRAELDARKAPSDEKPAPAPARPAAERPQPERPARSVRPVPSARPAAARASSRSEDGPAQRPLELTRTFDNFVVGPCNALAREASLAIADGRQPELNQLYLSAPTGLGKTHLAQAVLEQARAASEPALYFSAEGFTNAFLKSIQSKRQAGFKRRLREQCRVLIVEDVQFFAGKRATQLEFFHTVDHLLDAGGRVLLTADRLPATLTSLDERLRSQLSRGFVAELEAPDAQVRRNILRDRAARGGVRLPDECLDLLVRSIRGSVRELEGALIQLVTTASLMGKPIDLALAREALSKKVGGLDTRGRRLATAEVIGQVATFFKTQPEALKAKSRRRDVLVPRQLAMYLCDRYTDASASEIGKALGRDHPSVGNAIRKIERQMLERAPIRYQVEALVTRLDELATAD